MEIEWLVLCERYVDNKTRLPDLLGAGIWQSIGDFPMRMSFAVVASLVDVPTLVETGESWVRFDVTHSDGTPLINPMRQVVTSLHDKLPEMGRLYSHLDVTDVVVEYPDVLVVTATPHEGEPSSRRLRAVGADTPGGFKGQPRPQHLGPAPALS